MHKNKKLYMSIATIATLFVSLIFFKVVRFDFSNQYEVTKEYTSKSYLQSIEKHLKIKPHKDQVFFLNFWETWCTPCREEIPLLNKLKHEYNYCSNIEFIGISKDDSLKILHLNNSKNIFLNFTQYNTIKGLRSELRNLYLKDTTLIDKVPITFIINGRDSVLYYNEGQITDNDAQVLRSILSNYCTK